ncbi:MAG TPA: cytochrome c1 [Steroidobacteraceae bacterium]|jgi:ubiquinol-cytochrome c reductase cytochrome c1 subunit
MRTETRTALQAWRGVTLLAAVLIGGGAWSAETPATGEGEAAKAGANWQHWHADNNVTDMASVQRGARNFTSYCLGCHSLKYERWSRLGTDLAIPPNLLQRDLIPPGDKDTQYILTSMPAEDAANWFGKTPPDLTLMARARGRDYIFQFLKTFYIDPTSQTGANNLRLPTTAMPHVLSELEGLKRAVFRNEVTQGEGGQSVHERVFDHFETVSPGRLTDAQYDSFVRDTVNFLDYVSEPTQAARRGLGVWVVLFLIVFTWLAYLVKQEYWKDVH